MLGTAPSAERGSVLPVLVRPALGAALLPLRERFFSKSMASGGGEAAGRALGPSVPFGEQAGSVYPGLPSMHL